MSTLVEERPVVIQAPKFETATFGIEGVAPLVIHAFPQKARDEIKAKQMAGSTARKGKRREARDFDLAYEQAKHVSTEGWCGIAATAFRAAMISACRLAGFKMTLAKLSLFVEADGYDRVDSTPLVKITKGEPRRVEHMGRNADGGVDIRVRPMWDPGWEAGVRIRWDADQFTMADVANLMMRVGMQVGLHEGRPDSRNSGGMGWGLFKLKEKIR